MSASGLVSRLAAMNADEVRFRLACEVRKLAGRARHTIAPDRMDLGRLASILDPSAGPLVREAARAARHGNFLGAHAALGQHFATRTSRWPLQAARRTAFVDDLRRAFPDAARDSRKRANKIVDGRYDLLGYRDVELSNPPDWHADAINRRRAPAGHWTAIPYLDPAFGDHKVIWEVNRHQHWLTLGTGYWLTGDPAYRDLFIAQLHDWIASNPPRQGVNWASMLELAFRALSWTWSIEFFAEGAERDRTPWLVELLVSLDAQLTHISHNLSRYFSPNTHLTGEALALYAVSLALPELRRGGARVAEGRRILAEEAARQVNADGGHAELSPHYHRYTTDFYLLALMLARSADHAAVATFEPAARRLVEFLRTMADDRGRLPLIGDDDGGQLFRFGGHVPSDATATLSAAAAVLGDPRLAVAPPDPDVAWILGRCPQHTSVAASAWPSRVLKESGYLVSRWPDGSHLVFDAGAHGFLNGGHAHADALSVVLSVAGEPLLIDPGTATYVMDDELRRRMRSVRMHNTVVLNGREHSVPRGPFHWERRTDARMLAAGTRPDFDFAVGTHDGYEASRHTRAVVSIPGVGWLIADRMTGRGQIQADAWWHIHPTWRVSLIDGGVALASAGGRRAAIALTATDVAIVSDPALAAFAPEYGRIESATTLRSSQCGPGPFVMAAFVPAAPAARVGIFALPVERQRSEWVTCPFAVRDGDREIRVEVTFPDDPEAEPTSEWPQPCIEQLVQSCVE